MRTHTATKSVNYYVTALVRHYFHALEDLSVQHVLGTRDMKPRHRYGSSPHMFDETCGPDIHVEGSLAPERPALGAYDLQSIQMREDHSSAMKEVA